MLKQVAINSRIVPVPVPIRNLAEAVSWLERSMVPEDQSVTAMLLDGESVIESLLDKKFLEKCVLSGKSQLSVKIESAKDLALQGLETSHNLCGAILRNIKFIAVHLWQCPASQAQPELEQLSEDVEIIIDLIDHSRGLGVDSCVDFGPMLDLQAHLKKVLLSLSAAFGKSDWRACAQVLLRDTSSTTGLESTLKTLQEEFESAHLRLLTSWSAKAGNQ